MKVYIPTRVIELIDLTIEKEFSLKKITEKQKIKLSRQLISIWFLIYSKQRSDINITSLRGYTNIHSDDLSSFNISIGTDRFYYKKLLELLIDVELISINEKFSSSNFSKSYRIETDFINNHFEEVELDFDKVSSNIKDKDYWLNKYPNYTKQIEDLYLIDIELSEYVEWLRANIGTKLKSKYITKKYDGKTYITIEESYLDEKKIYEYINDALKVVYGNIWVKVSEEGRFYNSITNLSSTILPFLRINRRELKEIDITNCQPLILSKLINNETYRKDCEDGVFYDRLSDRLNITRERAKLLSYRYIFFNNNQLSQGIIYDAMVDLYGDVIHQINNLKKTMEIAKEMQKIESSIFVDKIGKIPTTNVMIRHDAVFVCKEDYEFIRLSVIRQFKNIGLNPKIK